jgi:hypothetical protein
MFAHKLLRKLKLFDATQILIELTITLTNYIFPLYLDNEHNKFCIIFLYPIMAMFILFQAPPDSLIQSTPGAMMNSLMSENKVVCSDEIPPQILSPNSSPNIGTSASSGPSTEPMDCNPTPELSPSHQNSSSSDAGKSSTEDVAMADNGSTCSGAVSITPTGSSNMQVRSIIRSLYQTTREKNI